MDPSCEPYLSTSSREARVSSQSALQVVLTLAMSTQVNGAWLDMDVHQVVDDAALDVILDAVHEESAAHVNHLDKRQVPESTENSRLNTLQRFVFNVLKRLLQKCTNGVQNPRIALFIKRTHNMPRIISPFDLIETNKCMDKPIY